MTVQTDLSHDALALNLATYLRETSNRMAWVDMQMGPSGSPRPDVYCIEPTYSRLRCESFEVKISVADFRRDVTAGKWQSYLKFSNSVTFAAPLGLIGLADVPTKCGLILRSPVNGLWRYARRPTPQHMDTLPWTAWMKLVLDGTERVATAHRLRSFNEWNAQQKLAKKFGEDVAKQLSNLADLPDRLRRETAYVEAELERLRANKDKEIERARERRKDEERQLDGTLKQLAIRLGCESESVGGLENTARTLLQYLNGDQGYYRRSPLIAAAESMENTALQLRTVIKALGLEHNQANMPTSGD